MVPSAPASARAACGLCATSSTIAGRPGSTWKRPGSSTAQSPRESRRAPTGKPIAAGTSTPRAPWRRSRADTRRATRDAAGRSARRPGPSIATARLRRRSRSRGRSAAAARRCARACSITLRGGSGSAQTAGAPGAKDARLLAADVLARRAEVIHVIEIDARHHGDVGIDDVDRVEPAAQPHFEDQRVEPGAREQLQRGQRAELEVGAARHVAARASSTALNAATSASSSRLAADAHALVVAQEMRRRVEPRRDSPRCAASPRASRTSSPCRWCRSR